MIDVSAGARGERQFGQRSTARSVGRAGLSAARDHGFFILCDE
jgi:hypothetical protein